MSKTFGSLKPVSASGTLMMPNNGRATITRRATTSMRGLFATNIPTEASNRQMTKSNSYFMASSNWHSSNHKIHHVAPFHAAEHPTPAFFSKLENNITPGAHLGLAQRDAEVRKGKDLQISDTFHK